MLTSENIPQTLYYGTTSLKLDSIWENGNTITLNNYLTMTDDISVATKRALAEAKNDGSNPLLLENSNLKGIIEGSDINEVMRYRVSPGQEYKIRGIDYL